MRNNDRRDTVEKTIKPIEQTTFGDRIKRGSTFVQYQNLRMLQQRAREGDALTLAT